MAKGHMEENGWHPPYLLPETPTLSYNNLSSHCWEMELPLVGNDQRVKEEHGGGVARCLLYV